MFKLFLFYFLFLISHYNYNFIQHKVYSEKIKTDFIFYKNKMANLNDQKVLEAILNSDTDFNSEIDTNQSKSS